MTDIPAPIAQPLLDPDGRIAGDLPCMRCGYNLRSLSPAGPCPECGTPIDRSLRGDLLRYRDPEWVGLIARGMTWTVRGINTMLGTLIALLVGGIIASLLTAYSGRGALPSWLRYMGEGLAILGLFTGFVGTLLGHWWLTTPDPSRLDEEQDLVSRRAGRLGLLGSLAAFLLVPAIAAVWFHASLAILVAAVVLLITGIWGLLGYLGWLALRIPDHDLVARTHSVRRGLVIVLVLYAGLFCTSMLFAIGPAALAPATAPAFAALAGRTFTCSSGIVGLMLLVYLSRMLSLLARYRKHLRQALEDSRANWAGNSAP